MTVALVLIPQSLAYAELAGMPVQRGLYAAALPPMIAALFASSPFLQTGPVALTSLLTASALASLPITSTADYVALAALLAVFVGLIRLSIGLLRAGSIAYLVSQPVLIGFTTGAALLIIASQVPSILGVIAPPVDVLPAAVWAIQRPELWRPNAIILTMLTLVLVLGSRRVHSIAPGILLAVIVGIVYGRLVGYRAPVVGELGLELPAFSLSLPAASVLDLIIAALVIGIIGFVEPASIARTYATLSRKTWDPNRELIGQGVANIVSGIVGGFPVDGSFSRSALNWMAGARTRWSGFITGAAVLTFLPFAFLLESLPKAVLGAIVISAVLSLIRIRPFFEFWQLAKLQFVTSGAAFLLTLALSPRVDIAAVVSIAISLGVHMVRELRLEIRSWVDADALHLKPYGVLWFATATRVEEVFLKGLGEHRDIRRLVVNLGGLGRIDVTGALVLRDLILDARKSGLDVQVVEVPPHAHKRMAIILSQPEEKLHR